MNPAQTTPHLLAIDVGTLSARAGLFDAKGKLIAAKSASFALMHPLDHHAVYRMDDIWAAVCAASRETLAAAPGLAGSVAGDRSVAHAQRASVDEHRRDRAAADVES